MLHYLSGKRTGIYYADSTHFAVCKNIRINSNRTFNNLAKMGRSSVDWFFGFKLHMIINDKGEIIAVKITKGNVDDRIAFEAMVIKKGLKGKCYDDKEFISEKMFTKLYKQGLIKITGIRKDMKNYLLPLLDKILLRALNVKYIKPRITCRNSRIVS
nr:hypothetical protein RMONA_1265 [Rickettsia monacensis IrR/Munich]